MRLAISSAVCLIPFLPGTASFSAFAESISEPQDVVFRSRHDGTEQRFVVCLPADFRDDEYHDVVVALHGHGADRWQFVNAPRSECQGSRDAAAERNAILVSPDYRASTSWMGPAATADVRQILDELHSRYRISRIIVAGGSMGGTSALAFAAMHPECVDGVICLNGTANLLTYDRFSEAITESFGGSREQLPDVYRERSAELFPERFTMPVAATTGGKDDVVPPDSVLRLVNALKSRGMPALSLHRPDGGHETDYEDTRAAFRFVFEQLDAAQKADRQPVLRDIRSPVRIVCLGDSVTGVYYHTGGQRAYPEMLEVALRTRFPDVEIRVINAGISGHTTANGLERLDRDVLQHAPTIVTISFGLNDLTRIPEAQFRSNLQELTKRCQTVGSQVVLCTPNAVIDTPDRPISRLTEYCRVIREVAMENNAAVCDQFAAGENLKRRAPRTWRLTMSDAIHPNMDGHRRMAEELCHCLSGATMSLQAVEPPRPWLSRTQTLLTNDQPIRVLAMEPFAESVAAAIRSVRPAARIEVTTWATAGKSLAQLEEDARTTVRSMKPDLVVLTIPAGAASDSEDQLIHSVSWIMNWSLSFGRQEWDCVVISPAVMPTTEDSGREQTVRQLIHAQHLPWIRMDSETADPAMHLTEWFRRELEMHP